MPPSRPPAPTTRADYHAFVDKFFADDAERIKRGLDVVVNGVVQRAQVAQDAVWQALCGGIEEWEKQRLLTMIVKGTALGRRQLWRGPDDDPATEPRGFRWSWLLNRSFADTAGEHEQAIKHVQALEEWAKKFSAGQHDDALGRLRRDIEAAIRDLAKFKAHSGRPPGRNWEAWKAAKAGLVGAGVNDASDLRKLREASALGRPDPELPA